MRFGVVRLESQRFFKFGDRLAQLTFLRQGRAETVVGFGIVRLDGKGFAIVRDSFVRLPALLEKVAKIILCFEIVRIDLESLPGMINCAVKVSLLQKRDA